MLISMQGNWTVSVKSKSAAFSQQFKIIGATTGNGTYTGAVSTPPVHVTGNQWSIGILNDPGTGFQSSDVRIKFPQKIGSNYVFDIESNDAGGDQDFNDLVLTCSTPALLNEFLIYGNVSLYSGPCIFNPCWRRWLVIDDWYSLLKAVEIPRLKEIISKIYPERVPVIIDKNPPDPPPDFKPIMLNLVDDIQLPVKQAQLFKRFDVISQDATGKKAKAAEITAEVNQLSNLERVQTLSMNTQSVISSALYDKAALAKLVDPYFRVRCNTEAASGLSLNFEEYDRTVSELAGNPYSGTGDRLALGSAITDMNGNYIFRFRQSLGELIKEYFSDYASGENHAVQILPDVIVKVEETIPVYKLLYESAPYFNIPNLKRIDLCLPKSKVPPVESFCFNGNFVEGIGNVYFGGLQNTTASFAAPALNRDGFNNHLRSNGVITVNETHISNPSSVFSVDCACWGGVLDVKGCLFDKAKRGSGLPEVNHYTIRYKKSASDPWQYVTEEMLHPLHHKKSIIGYVGDPFGPFPTNLNVDISGFTIVPAYTNIQREAELLINDWENMNLDIIIRLTSGIYQGSAPGTVYFRIDGYDAGGQPVSGATDMVALYIDNNALDFGLTAGQFPPSIEYVACGLYKMFDSELNTPLTFQFKAADLLNDPDNPSLGFVNDYSLTFGKCPSPMALDMNSPVIKLNITDNVLAKSPAVVNTEAGGCNGYKGTITDFGAAGFINVSIQPHAASGWLSATETFGVFSLGLTANRRVTNGYNSGLEGTYVASSQFSIIKK